MDTSKCEGKRKTYFLNENFFSGPRPRKVKGSFLSDLSERARTTTESEMFPFRPRPQRNFE